MNMTPKPQCIIVTGRTGAGKTTFAKRLSAQLWMPVISRDEIKEGYVNTFGAKHDVLPADSNLVVTNLFFDLVRHYLAGQISVVVEAAFQHFLWEKHLPGLRAASQVCFIVCEVDANEAARRHLQRGLDFPQREHFHGDQRVAHFRETGEILAPTAYIAPHFELPTLNVSTQGEYQPGLEQIVAFISDSARAAP